MVGQIFHVIAHCIFRAGYFQCERFELILVQMLEQTGCPRGTTSRAEITSYTYSRLSGLPLCQRLEQLGRNLFRNAIVEELSNVVHRLEHRIRLMARPHRR